jgi:hypothetical protein
MATLNGKIVLFGGYNWQTRQNFGETWTWDGTRWTLAATSGPAARSEFLMKGPAD